MLYILEKHLYMYVYIYTHTCRKLVESQALRGPDTPNHAQKRQKVLIGEAWYHRNEDGSRRPPGHGGVDEGTVLADIPG